MAKPTVLSDDVRDEIGRRLSSGCTLEVAAQAVGVNRRTIQTWLAVGREARDLAPTVDMRGLFKGVLADHMGLDRRTLDTTVFPDSAAARPLTGLV